MNLKPSFPKNKYLLLAVPLAAAFLAAGYFAVNSNNSEPWWRGSRTMIVCPVGQNANNYQGADTNNNIGCYTTSVTSDGTKITNLILRDGSSVSTQGTNCGKLTGRYCDFYDVQDRQWEVKKS